MGCARRRARTPGRCGRCRSCSGRPRRCGWSCTAGPRRRSPRSCITGAGSGSPSGPCRALRRARPDRAALAAAPKAYGRYEAERVNERSVTDVLESGPYVPYPKRDGSVRARLFLIVDDHHQLVVATLSTPAITPAPAATCSATPSQNGAYRKFSTPTTNLPSPTPLWRGPARCSGSAWCTVNLNRPRTGESRKGQTGISGRRSWPRPATPGSSPSMR